MKTLQFHFCPLLCILQSGCYYASFKNVRTVKFIPDKDVFFVDCVFVSGLQFVGQKNEQQWMQPVNNAQTGLTNPSQDASFVYFPRILYSDLSSNELHSLCRAAVP